MYLSLLEAPPPAILAAPKELLTFSKTIGPRPASPSAQRRPPRRRLNFCQPPPQLRMQLGPAGLPLSPGLRAKRRGTGLLTFSSLSRLGRSSSARAPPWRFPAIWTDASERPGPHLSALWQDLLPQRRVAPTQRPPGWWRPQSCGWRGRAASKFLTAWTHLLGLKQTPLS